jgi:biotin operon repressor
MSNPFRTRTKGYNKIPKELNEMHWISSNAYRIFIYFCSFDECFVSYKQIQKTQGITSRTISKAIKELLDNNMISYVKGYSLPGNSKANRYQILDTIHWRKYSDVLNTATRESTLTPLENVQRDPLEKVKATNQLNNNKGNPKQNTSINNDSSNKEQSNRWYKSIDEIKKTKGK